MANLVIIDDSWSNLDLAVAIWCGDDVGTDWGKYAGSELL